MLSRHCYFHFYLSHTKPINKNQLKPLADFSNLQEEEGEEEDIVVEAVEVVEDIVAVVLLEEVLVVQVLEDLEVIEQRELDQQIFIQWVIMEGGQVHI